MQLSPGERSILAYFPTSNAAEEAMEALKGAGIEEVQLDRVSKYGVSYDDNYNNPLNQANTLTGLTLYSTNKDVFTDNDERILMGADPSVSGMAAAGYGTPGEKAFLVTIVTNDEKLDQATSILKDKGAYF